MEIVPRPQVGLLELVLSGRLDNESDEHFRSAVDGFIRQGHHRIVVNLAGVSYLSSAGVSELVRCHRQVAALKGFFGVCAPSPLVEQVLRQTKLYDVLVRDREALSSLASEGTVTITTRTRVESRQGIDLEIYELDREGELACMVLGRPDPLFESAFRAEDCRETAFPRHSLGLGLGALGADFDDCRDRFGEFLAAAGAVAHASSRDFGVPDYLLAAEDFVPRVQVLYGLKCTGSFRWLLRFKAAREAGLIPVGQLAGLALQVAGCETAGLVIVGECDGLVGASLRKSPAGNGSPAPERFGFPAIRQWVSYGGERTHRRSLALVAGVAALRPPAAPLAPLLRPHGGEPGLFAHFHAAAFPYQPLKKRSLDLVETVSGLFAGGTIQSVLHLLHDNREIKGAGDSELVSGALWISIITETLLEA